jgi:SAM-dependent methyltransferase
MKQKLLRIFILGQFVLFACLILYPSLSMAQYGPVKKPDIYFVSTPPEAVEIMLRLADLKKNDVVYDLGCGDGRIVIAAAKKVGARAFGYEIDTEMVKKSQENVSNERVGHLVEIHQQDIFELDLRGATVITLYLLPKLNVRLIPQLDKLKPGVRIVSHEFDMEGVMPDVEAVVHRLDGKTSKIYLWTTPLKKIDKNAKTR